MKHTVIGLAGHIDHGKTALIRALTGIETDQLPEEQKRGITIDIGFAYWKSNITIIDVPGHEKFIRNMVAGVSTIDLFILVIAADDGIMPQTREHLEILKFFNVKNGVVVLSKTDLVEKDWLALVREEVHSFLEKNGFENLDIFEVSSETGEGVDQFREKLLQKIENFTATKRERPFRLNIDRSFYAKGFGSVVTGTVLSGSTEIDKNLVVLPEGIKTRVRSLQVHQKNTEQVFSGQRAAINLSGLTKEQLQRGKVLVEEDTLVTSKEILAVIKTTNLFKFKIKRFSEVRVHLGTSEIKGTINWIEESPILLNEQEYHVRIKLSEPAVCAPDDPVLIRSYSPMTTIGGGIVVMINPPNIKLSQNEWLAHFAALTGKQFVGKVRTLFELSENVAFSLARITGNFFEEINFVAETVGKLKKQKFIVEIAQQPEKQYAAEKHIQALIINLEAILENVVSSAKISKSFNFNEIRNLIKGKKLSDVYLKYVLQRMVNSKILNFDERGYTISKADGQEELKQVSIDLENKIKESGFNVPDVQGLATEFKLSKQEISALIGDLLRDKIIISINGLFYLHVTVFNQLIEFLKEEFSKQDALKVATVRDFTNSTRKFIIPIMEYLDREGFTKREGDLRFPGNALNG